MCPSGPDDEESFDRVLIENSFREEGDMEDYEKSIGCRFHLGAVSLDRVLIDSRICALKVTLERCNNG